MRIASAMPTSCVQQGWVGGDTHMNGVGIVLFARWQGIEITSPNANDIGGGY